MRYLIMHNGDSGFGSNAIFEFEREVLKQGDECVMRSLAKGEACSHALRDAEDFDLVVISGGDGTVTNALYALHGRNIKTCVFPSGTANLLFANLGCATEPKAIANACLGGVTFPLDLGEFSWQDEKGTTHTQGFGIMSGMGFDAQLMADASANKQVLGEAAYFAAALTNLNPPSATFTITVDGKSYTRSGISCIAANTATIQGDINVLPNCRMDDGLIDVMVLAATDAAGLLVPILAGIIDPEGGLLGRPRIERFRGKHIVVESSIPLPLQRDGDPLDVQVSSYEVRCLPASSRVIVDQHSPYWSAAE